MHMSFRISLTVPTKRPMCKINVYPKLVIEWFPNPRDLFALRDRVRRNKDGVYRGILHQFGRLIVPPCHIVNFTGSFIRLALFIYINPVFLDYNNEKHSLRNSGKDSPSFMWGRNCHTLLSVVKLVY